MNTQQQDLTAYLKICVYAFVILCACIGFALFLNIKNGIKVETDLHSLIPQNGNPATQDALNTLQKNSGNKAVFLLSSDNKPELEKFASGFIDTLKRSNFLNVIDYQQRQEDALILVNELQALPFNFLSSSQLELLESGNKQILLEQETLKFYDVGAAQGVLTPSEDPISLFNQWFLEGYSPQFELSFEESFSYLSTNKTGKSFNILVMTELSRTSLDIATMEYVDKLIEITRSTKPDSIDIYRSGIVFHAAESAAKSKQDITLIALGSTIGIVLLFIVFFSSIKPLLLSLGSILFACVSAAILTHAIFGQLHLFTLVFGASLMGITVDYSLHFFAKFYQIRNNNARASLSAIFPEISLGLLSSIIGFSCLLFSSIPSLDQIALFCITGLLSSWLFVVTLYPFQANSTLDTSNRLGNQLIRQLAYLPLSGFSRIPNNVVIIVSAASAVLLFSITYQVITWSKDIRALNASSIQLLQEESVVRESLLLPSANQFVLVQGSSKDETLFREEQLRTKLDAMIKEGKLAAYQATSRYIPSIKQQELNRSIIKSTLFGQDAALENFMNALGFSEKYTQDYLKKFDDTQSVYVSLDEWLQHAPSDMSSLWVDKIDESYTSIVLLRELNSSQELEQYTDKHDLHFVDTVSDISNNLNTQRSQAISLLIIAYAAISALLVFIYKSIQKLRLVFVPALSTLITLLALSAFNIEINLFHVFALFLIIGLGMDYSIFINQAENKVNASTSAIFLSALTSILSFGLLSISQIPMLHSFGITVLLGSLLNLILAPIANEMSNQ